MSTSPRGLLRRAQSTEPTSTRPAVTPRRRRRVGAVLTVASVLALGVGAATAAAQPLPSPSSAQRVADANGHHSHTACDAAPVGSAACRARVVDHGSKDATPLADAAPYGFSPATIKGYYGFPTSLSAGAGTTVAIVDAYDDPTAAADLATFDAQYGLPCSACFTKVNQTGGASYPAVNNSWAVEISLDVQWAHAIAPAANILLVETNSNNFSDLDAGVNYAKAHAQYVSLSWGGSEFSTESSLDSTYAASGVSVFVSAGDNGLPAEYPSASPNVISVGGTTLSGLGSSNPVNEIAWNAGGGGCSAYEPATSAQASFSQYSQVACGGKRATPDVALDADPVSGVSIVDSTTNSPATPWMMVGGTSLSTPMWAARSAVAGGVMNAARIYGSVNTPPFHDITTGNNGAPALAGYDLATGRGSWMDSGAPPPPPPPTNDFSISDSPSSVTLAPGASADSVVSTSVSSGSSSMVTLSTSVSPGGPSISLSPSGVMSGSSSTAAVNTGSAGAGTYTVTVTGTNGSMTHSVTLMVTVSSTPPPPPAIPGTPALTAQTSPSRGVLLTWAAPSGSPTSYTVYRSRSAGNESSYTTVSCSSSTCSYTDASTKRNNVYYYEITATNSAGTSSMSNESSAVAR